MNQLGQFIFERLEEKHEKNCLTVFSQLDSLKQNYLDMYYKYTH